LEPAAFKLEKALEALFFYCKVAKLVQIIYDHQSTFITWEPRLTELRINLFRFPDIPWR
jgi:hypothetical protein